MPLTRKRIQVGHSAGVTLPSSWIKQVEDKEGKTVTHFSLEINGKVIITPLFTKEKKHD